MKNIIKRVDLMGNGSKGIKIVVVEYREVEGYSVPTENVKKQKTAVPSDLLQSFRKLRYYLLETTERLPDEWKKFFINSEMAEKSKNYTTEEVTAWAKCQNLIDRTFIDAVEFIDGDGGSYRIFGRIESEAGYISKTESPMITSDHSTIFYREVSDLVGDIFEKTVNYIYGKPALFSTIISRMIEEDNTVADLSHEEQLAKAAKLLEKSGCIIIPGDDNTAKAISGDNAVTEMDDNMFGKVEATHTIHDHTVGEDGFTEFEEVNDFEDSEPELGEGEAMQPIIPDEDFE